MELLPNLRVHNAIEDPSFEETQLCHFFSIELIPRQRQVVSHFHRQSSQTMRPSEKRYKPSRSLITFQVGILVSPRHGHHGEHVSTDSFGTTCDLPENRFIELCEQDGIFAQLVKILFGLSHSLVIYSMTEDVIFGLDKDILHCVVVLVRQKVPCQLVQKLFT